jgi:hypothetical protein
MDNLRDVDRTHDDYAGVTMKTKTIFIILMIAFVLPLVSAVPNAAFDIYYLNSTDNALWPLTSLNATKGQLLTFNATVPAGSTTWAWDFGDGFTETRDDVVHRYTFGKNGKSLMLTNAWTTVVVKLNASDGATSDYQSKILNLTTAMAPLIFVGPSETIAPLNESYANGFIAVIGGNTSVPADWIGIDWLGGMTWVQNVYVSVLGATLFFILLFSIPFIMQWIISKDFVVAGIMGGIMGVWIINRLPANMKLLAVTFIAMSIVAIIYSLLKERT